MLQVTVRELVITLGFLLACGQQRSESKPMEQPTKTQHAGLTLELALGPPVDNRFGLVVSELQLTIRNTGTEEADIPEPGISMMLSLRTTLVRGSDTEHRAAGTGKPVTPKQRKLPAGQSVQVTISPLDDGPGESPLAEGTWQATVCLGEVCSNSVALAVTKR
jgi:hypothetical protein